MDEQTEQRDPKQMEQDFATEILDENKEVLEGLTLAAGTYAEEGRSDKLYILTNSVIMTLRMAQSRMKQSLGVDHGRTN
jgi:hypothetical protein